jgi:hypothetical protein
MSSRNELETVYVVELQLLVIGRWRKGDEDIPLKTPCLQTASLHLEVIQPKCRHLRGHSTRDRKTLPRVGSLGLAQQRESGLVF